MWSFAHGMYLTLLFWVFQQIVSYAPRLVFLTKQLAAPGSKFTPFWRVRKCAQRSVYLNNWCTYLLYVSSWHGAKAGGAMKQHKGYPRF